MPEKGLLDMIAELRSERPDVMGDAPVEDGEMEGPAELDGKVVRPKGPRLPRETTHKAHKL